MSGDRFTSELFDSESVKLTHAQSGGVGEKISAESGQ